MKKSFALFLCLLSTTSVLQAKGGLETIAEGPEGTQDFRLRSACRKIVVN